MKTFFLKTSKLGRKIYNFLNKKWFFDKIYGEYTGQFFFKFSYSISYKLADRGIFEILGPTGLSYAVTKISFNIYKMQTRTIYHYFMLMLLGITFLLCIRQIWIVFGFILDYRVLCVFIPFFFNV